MKNNKILSILLCLLLACSMMFTACGEKESETPKDEPVFDETTTVLETTDDGGTIEQDAEGNKITKDKDGNILSVEDSVGNSVNVEEYITMHNRAVNNTVGNSGNTGVSDSSAASGSPDNANGSGSSGGDKSSGSSRSDSGSSSGSDASDRDDTVEESIPVIIVTIPDDDDLVELPDL